MTQSKPGSSRSDTARNRTASFPTRFSGREAAWAARSSSPPRNKVVFPSTRWSVHPSRRIYTDRAHRPKSCARVPVRGPRCPAPPRCAGSASGPHGGSASRGDTCRPAAPAPPRGRLGATWGRWLLAAPGWQHAGVGRRREPASPSRLLHWGSSAGASRGETKLRSLPPLFRYSVVPPKRATCSVRLWMRCLGAPGPREPSDAQQSLLPTCPLDSSASVDPGWGGWSARRPGAPRSPLASTGRPGPGGGKPGCPAPARSARRTPGGVAGPRWGAAPGRTQSYS